MVIKIITAIFIIISLVFYSAGMFCRNDRIKITCSVYGGWFCLFAVIEIALKVVFSL